MENHSLTPTMAMTTFYAQSVPILPQTYETPISAGSSQTLDLLQNSTPDAIEVYPLWVTLDLGRGTCTRIPSHKITDRVRQRTRICELGCAAHTGHQIPAAGLATSGC